MNGDMVMGESQNRQGKFTLFKETINIPKGDMEYYN
jgi:hypothetical protein